MLITGNNSEILITVNDYNIARLKGFLELSKSGLSMVVLNEV